MYASPWLSTCMSRSHTVLSHPPALAARTPVPQHCPTGPTHCARHGCCDALVPGVWVRMVTGWRGLPRRGTDCEAATSAACIAIAGCAGPLGGAGKVLQAGQGGLGAAAVSGKVGHPRRGALSDMRIWRAIQAQLERDGTVDGVSYSRASGRRADCRRAWPAAEQP